ncbi:hypothetical protein TNCV_4476291 [Trichonephila clavipes]|nr:hypothetical protein TNCV_4476291 [Trichonephila clavipes]
MSRLFRGAVGDKFVFIDDNATCHRTLAVQGLSRQRGQAAGRNYPPTNKNTLIRAFTEEWDKLPQQLLDNVQKYGYICCCYSGCHLIDKGQIESTKPSWKSHSFEHHTGGQNDLACFHPIFKEDTLGWSGAPTSLPLPPTAREDLRLDGYLEYPMPQRHYTFTNIHVFSDSSPALRHRSQHR